MRAMAGEDHDAVSDAHDVPTAELPVVVVGPSEAAAGAAPGGDDAPGPDAAGAGAAGAAGDAAPAEPETPARPVRMIVIGDRDGLTEAPRRPSSPLSPVPAAVPNTRRGRLRFGDDVTVDDGPVEPPLVVGPPAPERDAAPTGPPRTIVIGDADEGPPDEAIDPRIKERRNRVLRAEGLRRLRWVLVAAAVLAVVVGFNLTLRSPLFQVRTVDISGTSYIDPAELAPVQQALVGKPLVSVSLDAVRRDVEENVWVRTVDVSRDWPHTIRIDIEERRPVAYYAGTDGLIHLADIDGRVLQTLEGLPTQFVMVEGAANDAGPGETAPEALLPAIRVANDLPETLRADVRKVLVTEKEGVVLQLNAGGVILIGDTTSLRDKLVSALAVRGQCPPGTYTSLDVRAPSRPAVTPKTGCNGPLNAAKP